jgi:hypothetical protein
MDALLSLFARLLDGLVWAKDPITVVLAVGAIVYAAIQKHESGLLLRQSGELKREADDLEKNTKAHADEMNVQRKAMEEITKQMRGIAASMSTKYVGDFPKNMDDICEVIALADRHLDIQVDLVAYGHYSNPEGFKKYMDRIEDLAKRSPETRIRLLVYAAETGEKSRAGQFGGARSFAEEARSERFRRFFEQLYKFPPAPTTYDQFVEYMANKQDEWRKRLDAYKSVEIRHACFPFRMFLWIEDEEEAVFAFELYGKNRTISFRSRDGNLIHTFGALFEHNWQECASKPPLHEVDRKPLPTGIGPHFGAGAVRTVMPPNPGAQATGPTRS